MKPLKSYEIQKQEVSDIWIENDCLQKLSEIVEKYSYSSLLILTDSTTQKLFLPTVQKSLEQLDIPVFTETIESGEQSKSIKTLTQILEIMLGLGLDRKSAVIALGGGVVGDLATTLSGLFFRGIDCIQIPTTLLSQVDSSMGGKGAVDIGIHKNTIGIIKQPSVIIIDPQTIKSLPKDQIKSGMGEIIKYATAMDLELFEKLESATNTSDLDMEWIIQRCVDLKMSVVVKDPMDTTGVRAILNFGHTLGQAIELSTHLSHGEAISIGMHFAILISEKLKLIENSTVKRITALLEKYALPITVSGADKEQVFELLKKDKKTIARETQFVLLKSLGNAITNQKVPDEIIEESLNVILEGTK